MAHGDTEVSHVYVAVCQLRPCAVRVQQPPRMCAWVGVCAHTWVSLLSCACCPWHPVGHRWGRQPSHVCGVAEPRARGGQRKREQ